MSTCPVCNARGDRPCTEADAPIPSWHVARQMAAARRRVEINHAAEAARLRDAAKAEELRKVAAERRVK